jgi:ubiquinone biosynthesis protein COQ9
VNFTSTEVRYLRFLRTVYHALPKTATPSSIQGKPNSLTMSPLMLSRSILRLPASIRKTLLQPQRHLYHSYEHDAPPPYPPAETAILSAAYQHVPAHGFTQDALNLGAKEAGYLDISTNLFKKGSFDLILYHLVTQRLALGNRVQFPDDGMSIGRKIRSLVLSRLLANAETGILPHWQSALGHMSFAENIPASLRELAKLSDEMWFQAGDVSVDTSWYTKRATLSTIYAATEVFQTQDQSTEFRDTEAFLDRRLEDNRVLGSAVGNTIQWVGFEAGTVVNLFRSKGVRI